MVVVSGPLLLQSAPFEMILVFVPSFRQELELPMFLQSDLADMSPFTQDMCANPHLRRTNLAELENQRFSVHEIVGRKGFEPSTPAMSRRYLNQARPPALFIKQKPRHGFTIHPYMVFVIRII